MLTENACLSKSKNVPWRIIEGEAILVNVNSSDIVHLNETGAEIWRIIDGKTSISKIIEHISSVFEVNKEVAKTDVLKLLEDLIEKNILEASSFK